MNTVIILAASGIVSMFAGVFNMRKWALPILLLACAAALGIIFTNTSGDYTQWMQNMLVFDAYSRSFSVIMILLTACVLCVSAYYYKNNVEHQTDIYALFLFSLVGGILLVSFQNLIMLFLGIEILSIPLYILSASNRRNLFSNEAGLKYYLMGSFASCFLLLGITLIYGMSGSFDMDAIAAYVQTDGALSPLFITGCLLLAGAFIFKVSAVPFHFWAPDVYQGSPTVITSFMATVVKTAAFGGFIRFISNTILLETEIWQHALYIVAALTVIIGNITALYQGNLKRLLAYSGIANAGYVLVAVATMQGDISTYVLYYMAGYGVATILAFAVYSAIKDATGIDSINDLKGLYARSPILTIALAFSMLSLAGIPPLAGFVGKYAVFAQALHQDAVWLVVIAIVMSLIGVYYYLRVMVTSMQSAPAAEAIQVSSGYRLLLIVGILLLLGIGIYPDLVFGLLY